MSRYIRWSWLLIGILIGFSLISLARASDITVNWTPPTGSEVCSDDPTPADVGSYRIFQLVATITDPAQTSHVFSGNKPGDYEYISTSVRTDGAESRISNSAIKTVTEMTVVTDTVFTVVRSQERFILLPTGTIPVGTVCDHTQSVNGHYVVPKDQVTYTGTVRPSVVVAECT